MNCIDMFWTYLVLVSAMFTSVLGGIYYGRAGAAGGAVLGGGAVIAFVQVLRLSSRVRPRWPLCAACGTRDWSLVYEDRAEEVAWRVKCRGCRGDFLYELSTKEFLRVLPDGSAQPVGRWSLLGGWGAKAPTNGEAHG